MPTGIAGAQRDAQAGAQGRGQRLHRRAAPRSTRLRWTLWQVASFVRRRGYWPSAPELVERLGRGSRWTCRRDLATLAAAGFLEARYRCWAITGDGWAWLGAVPVTPVYRDRVAARTGSRAAKKARRALVRRDACVALDGSLPVVD